MKRVLCFLLCAVLWVGLAQAQGVTTGSLSGVVKDPDGAVVPGVTVVATLEADIRARIP